MDLEESYIESIARTLPIDWSFEHKKEYLKMALKRFRETKREVFIENILLKVSKEETEEYKEAERMAEKEKNNV